MDKQKLSILIIDDDEDDYIITQDFLSDIDWMEITSQWIANYTEGLQALVHNTHDLCFLDYRLGERTGLELLGEAMENGCKTPIILLTGQESREIDVEAMKAGAVDYLVKSAITTSTIERAIRYTVYRKQAERELHQSQEELLKKHEELNRLYSQVEAAKQEWESTMDCIGDMIILIDQNGKIMRCNHSLISFFACEFKDVLGKDWKSLLAKHNITLNAAQEESQEIFHKPSGKWFILSAYPFKRKFNENLAGTVITLTDSTELITLTNELERTNKELQHASAEQLSIMHLLEYNKNELEKAYEELKQTQSQILQQEKMASIGQLAAGVAHEINNPTGYIMSNLGTLQKYHHKLNEFIGFQSGIIESSSSTEAIESLKDKKKALKINYILEDIDELIKESQEGAERVKEIVMDLKSFSRVDAPEQSLADLNECLQTTLNIVWNEVKYKAEVTKDFGDIPQIKCFPQQLNQVFMNLLVNAAHAIDDQGQITIKTWADDSNVYASVSDTGCGIAEENIAKLFEPFFTTKDVGKGTGLGLSIAYDIVKKHDGDIAVHSEAGKGTTFTLNIPMVV